MRTRAGAEAELRGHIGRIFSAHRRVHGSPRVHAELGREGRRHSRRRVARLRREMGLQARRGRRRTPRTTDSRHDLPAAPNLLGRCFAADRPATVWLADISLDLPLWSGGVGSERHAALSMVVPSMPALASAGVR